MKKDIDVGQQAPEQKTHYKLYKAKKRWLVAGITAFGIGLTTAVHSVTVQAAENDDVQQQTDSQSLAQQSTYKLQTSVSTTKTTEETDTTATGSDDATQADSSATSTSTTTDQTSSTDTQSTIDATQQSSSTTTKTADTDSSAVNADAQTTSEATKLATLKQAVVATGASWAQGADGTVTITLPVDTDPAAMQTLVNDSGVQTAVSIVASSPTEAADTTTDESTSDETTADEPSVNSTTTTGDLNNQNLSNFGSNVDKSGQLVVGDGTEINSQDVVDNFTVNRSTKSSDGTISTENDLTITPGNAVTLVDKTSQTAASLAFNQQIDTSSAFELEGYLNTDNNAGGGGLGVIFQNVDPHEAGIQEGSDPSLNLGIAGQKYTTFVGWDGYYNKDSADTKEGTLSIRQIDNYTGSVADFSKTDNFKKINGDSTSIVSTATGNKLANQYFTLTWTPDTTNTGGDTQQSGTLTFSSYSDEAKTQLVQTVSGNIDLQATTAMALFGATGGNDGITRTAGVTKFTLTPVAVPVQIHYVNKDGSDMDANGDGQIDSDDTDTVYVNVGSTLNIDRTTDVDTQTFAPRVIKDADGKQYSFVGTKIGSIYTDASGNQSASLTVQNPKITSGAVTDITIYYAPADTSRTI